MFDNRFITKLVDKLKDALPEHASSLKTDFEKNCHSILTRVFSKLDLVTREEFDIQTKVLLRTRKKMDELSKQIQELEAMLQQK